MPTAEQDHLCCGSACLESGAMFMRWLAVVALGRSQAIPLLGLLRELFDVGHFFISYDYAFARTMVFVILPAFKKCAVNLLPSLHTVRRWRVIICAKYA
jgi:hypothetical protein